MKTLNLTTLIVLTFIANAGYGSEDLIPADGSTMVAAAAGGISGGASGGASSTDSFRCTNYWIDMISGFLIEDYQSLNSLPEGEWEDLLRDPRLISVEHNRGLVTTASKRNNLGVLETRQKWTYNEKIEEFITFYLAQAPRDDAALKDKLSEIRPDDAESMLYLLNQTIPFINKHKNNKPSFIKDILNIPPEQGKRIMSVIPILTKNMHWSLIIPAFKALKALASVPHTTRENVVEELPHLTKDMSEGSTVLVIIALANASFEVLNRVLVALPELTIDLCPENKFLVIEALANAPIEVLNRVLEHLRDYPNLTEGMNEWNKVSMIVILTHIPEKKWDESIAAALATKATGGNIIEALKPFSGQDRK